MSTEILGYMARPQTVTQKPAECPTAKRNIMNIQIPDVIMQKLSGIIMMEIGALTLPICDGDGNAFVMFMLFGIIMMIGGRKE